MKLYLALSCFTLIFGAKEEDELRLSGPHTNECGNLKEHFAANNFENFGDLKENPLKNYKIRNKIDNITSLVLCKRVRTDGTQEDKDARARWELEAPISDQMGLYVCENGNWNEVWPVPVCPDRTIDGAWAEFWSEVEE